MKKLLLFTLAIGLGTMTYAQSIHQSYRINEKSQNEIAPIDLESMNNNGPVNKHTSSKGAISFITIGYSANVYTMLVEQEICLTTNEDIGVLSFTHRGGYSTGSTASGDILNSHSTDGGLTWTTHKYLNNSAGYNNRYPTGVIYNPISNTIADSAFIVYCGPSHDGGNPTATWDNTYFGSGHFDASKIHNQYIPSFDALVRMGMTATSDGKIHVMGASYTEVSQTPTYTYKTDTVYLMTGTFNSTSQSFDWSTFKIDSFNFITRSNGSHFSTSYHWNSAWAEDGVIGYYWTLGRDATNDFRSYQPLVWKTTNSGTTWIAMTPFDFTTLTEITSRLQPMQGMMTSRPQFSTSLDGVVDANGDLHLISQISAAFSNDNDSLGHSYVVAGVAPEPMSNPIYDVYTTSTGWSARYLGSTYTIAIPSAQSGYGADPDDIGWDLRLQAGRTKNGDKIFASWSDSDTTFATDITVGTSTFKGNMFPNLFVAAWDIVSGKQTNATNFTMGSSQDGDGYFHFMSNIIIADNGTYTIPMTEIDKGNSPTDPITHNFVKGVEFTDADFVTNPGFATKINEIATVSQNRPNPFTGFTTIDVNLTQASNVVIEVMNVTGQKVMEMNNGRLNAGSHTFQINGSNLSSGVYFYTVHAGNSSVTKKMIVQ